MACMCGDPLCPSCGTAQGTYRAPRRVPTRRTRPVPTFGDPGPTSTRYQKRATYFARVAQHAVADVVWAADQMRRKPGGALWLTAPVHVLCWAVGRAVACAQGTEK